MGLANMPPSKIVTHEEVRRILSAHGLWRLPDKVKERIKLHADSFIRQTGHLRGMNERELEQFLNDLEVMVPETWRGKIPVLRAEFKKALNKHYGSFL